MQELQEKERKHSDVIDELRGQYNRSRISSGNEKFQFSNSQIKILDHQIDEQIKQKKDFEAKYQRAIDTIAQLRREIGDLQSKYNARFEISISFRANIRAGMNKHGMNEQSCIFIPLFESRTL